MRDIQIMKIINVLELVANFNETVSITNKKNQCQPTNKESTSSHIECNDSTEGLNFVEH